MRPFINIGPGEFIQEELEIRNWTQQDLANILGTSLKFINELIKNKQAITIDTARLLSKAFGQSPQYWLNLDNNYRLRLPEKQNNKAKEAEAKALFYQYMPIRDMMKRGWLNQSKNISELENSIKLFWGRNDTDLKFLDKNEASVHYRKSIKFSQYNLYYSKVWFQMAVNSAKTYTVAKYDKSALEQLADNINQYTVLLNGVEKFLSELNKAGVKFIILKHLEKTYIDGASFYDGNNPVIVYTCRHNRLDNFWFTIAHEIAHILMHFKNKNMSFIDNLDDESNDIELQADNFASDKLKTNKILKYFTSPYITKVKIEQCSRELKINPSIIVGILQHHKRLSPRNLNGFKIKADEFIPKQYWVENKLAVA